MSKEPSHVAVYLNSLFNGGIEKPLFHLMQGLISRGIKVDLVLDYLTYSPFEALIPESTRVIKFGVRSLPSRLSALSRYLREEKPDAMLAGSRLEVRKVERGKPNTSHIKHAQAEQDLRNQSTMSMAWIATELDAGMPQTLWRVLWIS